MTKVLSFTLKHRPPEILSSPFPPHLACPVNNGCLAYDTSPLCSWHPPTLKQDDTVLAKSKALFSIKSAPE